jgi:hypothetical protein
MNKSAVAEFNNPVVVRCKIMVRGHNICKAKEMTLPPAKQLVFQEKINRYICQSPFKFLSRQIEIKNWRYLSDNLRIVVSPLVSPDRTMVLKLLEALNKKMRSDLLLMYFKTGSQVFIDQLLILQVDCLSLLHCTPCLLVGKNDIDRWRYPEQKLGLGDLRVDLIFISQPFDKYQHIQKDSYHIDEKQNRPLCHGRSVM